MHTYSYANEQGTLILRDDGAYIPVAPGNKDYDDLVAAGIEPVPFVPVVIEDIPADLSSRQFYNGLWRRQEISDAEFLGALGGELPGVVNDVLNDPQLAVLLEPTGLAIVEVKALLLGAKTFQYNHVLTPIIAQVFGWTEAETRAFWLECAAL